MSYKGNTNLLRVNNQLFAGGKPTSCPRFLIKNQLFAGKYRKNQLFAEILFIFADGCLIFVYGY